MTTPSDRAAAWERRTEWPLTVAAVVFLVAYALPILRPGLDHDVRRLCTVTDYTLWVIFVLDFAWRVLLTTPHWRYVWRHSPELLTLALPVLRPLRLLRLVLLLRLLDRRAADSLRGRVAAYVVVGTGLVVFCASLAILDAERGRHGANIATFGDALWWAATTITTVGYGDRYPVTTEGRFVAVGLMLSGIALLGIVTASVATWLVDRVRAVEIETAAVSAVEIRALRDEIAKLRADLAKG